VRLQENPNTFGRIVMVSILFINRLFEKSKLCSNIFLKDLPDEGEVCVILTAFCH
jgi:hypothetical protein